jgi:hypothetical protein
MVTENFERAGRRLTEHHRKLNYAAVGMRSMGCELVLSRQYDDHRGQLAVLKVSVPEDWARLDTVRLLAQSILGKSWMSAYEIRQRQFGRVDTWFVIELDVQFCPSMRPVQLRDPQFVRWFEAEKLGKGIGDQHQGFCTLGGRSLVRVSE